MIKVIKVKTLPNVKTVLFESVAGEHDSSANGMQPVLERVVEYLEAEGLADADIQGFSVSWDCGLMCWRAYLYLEVE